MLEMTVAISITPTHSQLQQLLGSFLVDILPPNTSVIGGQPNQVAEPKNPNFVIMTPIRFERLSTDFDGVEDVRFMGTVIGNILSATNVTIGAIIPGAILFGPGIPFGTRILSQSSGVPGGAGNYTINSSVTTVTNKVMAAGLKPLTQKAAVTVQCDFHAASYLATDMAETLSTAFRDEYATRFFKASGLPITPLYADDPIWRPFINAEGQYEWRWVVEAKMEIDQTIRVPQQFADKVHIDLRTVPFEESIGPAGPSLDYSRETNSMYQPGLGS